MEGTQAFDDLVGLEKSLWHQIKSLTADLYHAAIASAIKFLCCSEYCGSIIPVS